MDSFNKRQKELRRLERQRDKAAKRKEIKARKAAGLPGLPDESEEVPGDASKPEVESNLPPTN